VTVGHKLSSLHDDKSPLEEVLRDGVPDIVQFVSGTRVPAGRADSRGYRDLR
jgi:hypothetical protein